MPPSVPVRARLSQNPIFDFHVAEIIAHFSSARLVDLESWEQSIHNHVFNHVAISVSDCDAAVEWYRSVFGFKRIRGDRMTDRSAMPNAPIFKIYPKSLEKAKVAWLGTGNSVGFEVFEFIEPKHQPDPEFLFNRSGFFHIAVTAPDVEAALERAIEQGGKQIGECVDMGGGEKALYLTDPWGNVIEVLSCSFESLLANK